MDGVGTDDGQAGYGKAQPGRCWYGFDGRECVPGDSSHIGEKECFDIDGSILVATL